MSHTSNNLKIQFKVSVFLIAFCATFLFSCTKQWLNEKTSQDLTIPKTLKDFQTLLNNTQVFNVFKGDMREMAADGHYFNDSYFSGGGNRFNNYTWSKHVPYLNVYDWADAYETIVYCNVVLEGIDKITPENAFEQSSWRNIKGEALFYRSYFYFELAQTFAVPYNSSVASPENRSGP